MNKFCNIKKNTECEAIDECIKDFDCNIDKYVSYLKNQIKTCDELNNKYSKCGTDFFPADSFKKKLEFISAYADEYNVDGMTFTPIECYPTEQDEKLKSDPVNHPNHYETGKFECIEVMREIFGDEELAIYCKINAFKYLYRTNNKNGEQDIDKAIWYLTYRKKLLGNEDN